MCQLTQLPPIPTLDIAFSAPVPWGWYASFVVACVIGYYWRFRRLSQRTSASRRAILLFVGAIPIYLATIFLLFQLGPAWQLSTKTWYSAAIAGGSDQCYFVVTEPTYALLTQIGDIIFYAGYVFVYAFLGINWLPYRAQARTRRETQAVAAEQQHA